MSLAEQWLFPLLWFAWVGYWLLMSRGGKAVARREPLGSRLLHVVPLMVAAGLLWHRSHFFPALNERFMPWAEWEFWVGAGLTAAGLIFTVWARIHLGRNWSGVVTVKEDHELIQSGPYALVRHPIYTGLLLAFAGTALAVGEWRGVVALAIVVAALWRKLRFEERWMREQFGEQYLIYSRRVAALIPFLL